MKISEPYDYDDLSFDDYKRLIILSIAAWNIANMPEEQRAEQALEFLMSMPVLKEEMAWDLETALNDQEHPQTSLVMAHMMKVLMRRKLEFYPNDERILADYKAIKQWAMTGLFITISPFLKSCQFVTITNDLTCFMWFRCYTISFRMSPIKTFSAEFKDDGRQMAIRR